MSKILFCLIAIFLSPGSFASTLETAQVKTAKGAMVNVEINVPDALTGKVPALVLAPGQGYHMDLPILKGLAESLSARGILVYRFNWNYFSSQPQGQPSDDLSKEVQDMQAVVNLAKADARTDTSRMIIGGKSLGSLVSYQVFQHDQSLKALVLLTPVCTENFDDENKLLPTPETSTEMNYPGLAAWNKPILLASGNQDALCSLPMLYDYLKDTRGNFALVEVAGNHSWNISDANDDAAKKRNQENIDAGVEMIAHWLDIFLAPNEVKVPSVDLDWNTIAADLQNKKSNDELYQTFANELPSLLASVQSDAKNSAYHSLWGQSINFDELAKGTIVAPNILDFLLAEFQAAPRQDRYSHAGLEHTYGYLFSTLHTAFGFKRARWITPDIEVGFGLPAGLMGPFPAEGTLFSNVTYLASHIAFRDKPELLAIAEKNSGSVALEVKNLAKSKFTIRRLEENLSAPFAVKIHTDIVSFTQAPATQGNQYWLVYSIDNHLITAFPVAQSFVDGLFDPKVMGDKMSIQTKYNAYVPGITDSPTPLLGTRTEL